MIFFLRLVTVDETWVHYYEPENKAQSRQWVGLGPRGQRSSKHNHLLARWWPQYFGTHHVGRFTQEKYNSWSVLCKLARPAAGPRSAVGIGSDS